ncbi:hypothetical protein HanIR_Chr05g0253961 [Helianthus annuus]|nr:hypothetical protein HanIR_Chr05g0253961 [Helianthus annuus]
MSWTPLFPRKTYFHKKKKKKKKLTIMMINKILSLINIQIIIPKSGAIILTWIIPG